MKVTINELIEIQKKVKEADEEIGIVTVKPKYVQVLSSHFDKLFGAFAFTIKPLNQQKFADRFEKKVVIDGVTFVCIRWREDLTKDDLEQLGLEDDF